MGKYKGIRVVPKSETLKVYTGKKVEKRHSRTLKGYCGDTIETLEGHLKNS